MKKVKNKIPLFAGICCSLLVFLFLFLHRSPVSFTRTENPGYSSGLGYVPCDQLLTTATDMPQPLFNAVNQWVHKHHRLITQLLTIPPMHSVGQFKRFNARMNKKARVINLSDHNFIFDIECTETPAVIKIAGFPSRISSMISSLGYDPYASKWWKRNDLISRATHHHIPTQQHISRAATHHLLNQMAGDFIEPINTYLYHIPHRPLTCDDRNYIIVQDKLNGYIPVSSLDEETKELFFATVPLEKIYHAIKYANLWDISEDNLWVRDDLEKIAYPDGEKPDNEGNGQNARWKVAILGLDSGKLKYNIRNWYDGGHRKFQEMLKNYAPERVARWNQLYTSDPEVQYT